MRRISNRLEPYPGVDLGPWRCSGRSAARSTVRVGIPALRAFLRRRRPRRAQATPLLDEERDSVFSWSHLLDQLIGVLRRWLGGHVGDAQMAGATRPDLAGEPLRSVRSHYRQVLLAARLAGHPRRIFETPLELDSRLAPLTDDAAARALANLTGLYDAVRYGGHLETSDEVATAAVDAEAFVAALQLSSDPDFVDDEIAINGSASGEP